MANNSIGLEGLEVTNRAAEIASVENHVEMAAIPGPTATQAAKLDDPYLVAFAEPFDAENPK